MTDFDRDPAALAWARTKVQAYLERLAAFEQQSAAAGDEASARCFRIVQSHVRSFFLGDGGCVIGAFDPRRPDLGWLPARTTPDNPAASGDAADNLALREQITVAVTGELTSDQGPFGVIPRIADAVLAVIRPHGKFLGDQLRDAEEQLAEARAELIRSENVRDHLRRDRDQLAATLGEVLGRFDPAFPRPDEPMRFQATVSIEDRERWRAVLDGPAQDGGPSVAEAADNDRRWDLQREGE